MLHTVSSLPVLWQRPLQSFHSSHFYHFFFFPFSFRTVSHSCFKFSFISIELSPSVFYILLPIPVFTVFFVLAYYFRHLFVILPLNCRILYSRFGSKSVSMIQFCFLFLLVLVAAYPRGRHLLSSVKINRFLFFCWCFFLHLDPVKPPPVTQRGGPAVWEAANRRLNMLFGGDL